MEPGIWRNKLEEARENYSVEYKPADSRFSFAILQLSFYVEKPNASVVERSMYYEMDYWLHRFSVPIHISSWDLLDDSIQISDKETMYLSGYIEDGKIISSWKSLDFPQQTTAELEEIYKEVPFRYKELEQSKMTKRWSKQALIINSLFSTATLTWFVLIPGIIQIVSFWIAPFHYAWFNWVICIGSWLKGFYEAAKKLGWIKPSKRELEKAERQRKMEYYFYHCEQSPIAFAAVLKENLHRDNKAKNLKKAKELGVNLDKDITPKQECC